MKLLTIETSTPVGSVAVTDDEKVLAEESYKRESSHAEVLLQVTDRVLSSSGLKISDMDGFAVAIGPGSFTGLRVGLATAKGLALAANRPLVGVSSLEALALNVMQSCGHAVMLSNSKTARQQDSRTIITPCLDAHRDEVYAAVYKFGVRSSKFEVIFPECSIGPEMLCEEILGYDPFFIFLGDGAVRYAELFKTKLGTRFVLAPEDMHNPRASSVAFLSLPKFREGNTDDIISLIPNYIRRTDAELKRK